eukprot:4678745-Ditylum_brightwellii.AAC.1
MENDAVPDPAIKDQFDWDEDVTMQPTTQEEGKGSGKRKSSKLPMTAAKISNKHSGVRLTAKDNTTTETVKDKIK